MLMCYFLLKIIAYREKNDQNVLMKNILNDSGPLTRSKHKWIL